MQKYKDERQEYGELIRKVYTAKEVITETYELKRHIASQVVVVLLADLDRLWKPEEPHAVPAMYFFRGYSLSMDIMRQLLEACKKECKHHALDVSVCSADGEFYNLMVNGKDGQPLTEHQLSKEVWTEVIRLKKNQIISNLKDTCVPYKTAVQRKVTIALDNIARICVSITVEKETNAVERVRTPVKGWIPSKFF